MKTIELTTDYEQQALDFLNATSTDLTIKYKSYGVHFADDTVSRAIFRIRLKNKLGSFSFDFGQSIAGGMEEPTAYDVLACITKYDPESFEDFCADFGYEEYEENTGRRNKASFKIYCAVLKEWYAVEKLFSYEQIELLREIQ